jgi:hypothetical protein
MYTDNPLIDPSFRSFGATVAHVAPTHESNNDGSLGSELSNFQVANQGSSPQISYTNGTTYPVGDARNYLPELTGLGTPSTATNLGEFNDVGNGVPYFSNPPSLPAVAAATTGGVTASEFANVAPSAVSANEYAEAASGGASGFLTQIADANGNGAAQPLGPQVSYADVSPSVSDSTGTASVSTGPNYALIFILVGIGALAFYLYKSHAIHF